jgi:PhnB protein
MPKTNVYFHFDGHTREAMGVYACCFGGEPTFTLVRDTPLTDQFPDQGDLIMHAELHSGGIVLMASDMVGPEGLVIGNNITVSIHCESIDQMTNYFQKLSDGGKIICAISEMFWGDTFGAVNDRFGVQWMLTCRSSSSQPS